MKYEISSSEIHAKSGTGTARADFLKTKIIYYFFFFFNQIQNSKSWGGKTGLHTQWRRLYMTFSVCLIFLFHWHLTQNK